MKEDTARDNRLRTLQVTTTGRSQSNADSDSKTLSELKAYSPRQADKIKTKVGHKNRHEIMCEAFGYEYVFDFCFEKKNEGSLFDVFFSGHFSSNDVTSVHVAR